MEKSKRLLSLDILRGITVAGMILVNNGWGESFEMLRHSKWNGMTPCDLVFPFFLFIMGISCYLSLVKSEFKPTPQVVRRIVKRTVLLFVIGLFINWFDHAIEGDFLCFDHLRIWAVMQRIALCYGIVSLFALFCNHKYTIHVIVGILVVYTAILVLGNGYAYDADVNILAQADLKLFGYDHIYHKSPVDPEGLLGTISSVAHVLLGFYCGMLIRQKDTVEKKVIALFVVGTVLVIGGYLLSYGLPINKRIWSPSYVMMTCGLASLLQASLMYVVDIQQKTKWTTFFHVFGVNALALYVSSELLQIFLKNVGMSEMIYNGIHTVIVPLKWASLVYALYFVLLNFAIGYILYRKKIYIKL
ncbi:acyltransferase family protein [Prevotella sp. FD3004]|uniref:acyltransferase family protein n=1 Tax=Prevotella sp. FD3004 TaxID=1408309 RepID=UPI0005615E2A|nr:heparan-alpha-glucosaminide N-acetyltransferase domain-containing protein [Prevotella sp. FD3004]